MRRLKFLTRKRLLLFGTLILAAIGAAIYLPNYVLREDDKVEVTRAVTAWIVEGRSLPGFGEAYPDAQWMPSMKRFFVVCDYLPPEMEVSSDSRVRLITRRQEEVIFKQHPFDKSDYLYIELIEDSPNRWVFEVSNVFGPLAGHGYRFVVYRKLWGLVYQGKLLHVSLLIAYLLDPSVRDN